VKRRDSVWALDMVEFGLVEGKAERKTNNRNADEQNKKW
jgi:hypothetical protein